MENKRAESRLVSIQCVYVYKSFRDAAQMISLIYKFVLENSRQESLRWFVCCAVVFFVSTFVSGGASVNVVNRASSKSDEQPK